MMPQPSRICFPAGISAAENAFLLEPIPTQCLTL